MTEAVIIYTDGSCNPNPGIGGWGATLQYKEHVREICGGEMVTTNNRMELMAAIMALEALKRPCSVVLHTDCKYVQKGITQRIEGWIRRGWLNVAKEPIKNQELWQRLQKAAKPHQIKWKWVKGHSGVPGNERADELATIGRQQTIDAQKAMEAA